MTFKVTNPYIGTTTWQKGNIHVHTKANPDKQGSPIDYVYGGDCDDVIRKSLSAPFNFDFICTSIHPYIDAIDTFTQTVKHKDIVVIPGREIQNDTINYGHYEGGYFRDEKAKYIHALTMGRENGVSLCCHPNFFETTRPREGGEWRNILESLLFPCARLKQLNLVGIEVYNGLSMLEEDQGSKPYYPYFSETCWDDLLTRGYKCLGFAGNDDFYRPHYVYENYAPLGYIQVAGEKNEASILSNIKSGNFYASTGIELDTHPLLVSETDDGYDFHLSSPHEVIWQAIVFERQEDDYVLQSYSSGVANEWTFTQRKKWKYIRFQASSALDDKRRAWLQPIYGPDWTDHGS
ncbi:hypothetical protein OJHNALOF_01026 [Oceanimonas sp. MB9]|nr:hypothetical protein [Oceanimonas sp. MB9]